MSRENNITLLFLIVVISFASTTFATEYWVSPFGSDSNSGQSSSAPFKTFQKAVGVLRSQDVLNVLPGLYSGTANAQITFSYEVSVISTDGPEQTIVIGPGLWTIRSDVSITGIQFTNFPSISSSVFSVYNPGSFAMYFTLDDVVAYSNNLIVSVTTDLSYVTLNNCNFTENKMILSHGKNDFYNGAIYVENSTFSSSGGINGFFDYISLINSTFENIECAYQGCALSVNLSTSVTINQTNFFNCVSTSNGGALYFSSSIGSIVIDNSTFARNSGVNGGAIYSLDTTDISNSYFEKNNASVGGAFYVKGTPSSSTGGNVQDTLFYANSAVVSAGAIYCEYAGMNYRYVDFSYNDAPVGESYQCGTGCYTFLYNVQSEGNTASCSTTSSF